MTIEPGQTWGYDLFRPEDAEGVAALFRQVYGEGYPIRHFIEPDLLRQKNATQEVVSSVARTPKGDIVGHNALFQSAPFAGIRESGAGVVHPAYRGGAGIFKGMCQHGEVFLDQQMQGQALHCEPVCNHVFSQKLCHGLNWLSFAVEVDLMPASAYTQEKSAEGRVTTLVGSRALRPRPHRVHLPARFDRQIRAMYANLNDSREFVPAAETPPPPDLVTRIVAQVFGFARVARLAVHEIGADFAEALDREAGQAAAQGTTVFQVWLNAGRPWVGWAVELLRQRGYFLGGPLPRWFDDDGLLMQRMEHRPHWESINLAFDDDRELVRLVREDWESLAG
jgi:hypothetical protein